MEIEYSQTALKDLKKFDQTDRAFVIKKLLYLCENYTVLKEGKKVREIVNSQYGKAMRFTINRKIRVIFKEEDERLILLILRVGLRSNIYDEI